MRRAISSSVAAVALVLCCLSPAWAQALRQFSSTVTAGPAPVRPPNVRSHGDNCHVSRGRLLGGNVVMLAPRVLQYPLGYGYTGYTPPYQNYYRPDYGNAYSMANLDTAGPLSQAADQGSNRSRSLRTRHDLAKSNRLMASGDAKFAAGQYVLAIARYREAARAAPDASEARLRQSLGLIAAGKYSAASRLLHEALAGPADWKDSNLQLGQLYAPGELGKTTQALVRLAEADPRDPDLALALGVQLYFSGQRERAEMYLTRAAQLGAVGEDQLTALVPKDQDATAVN